MASSSELNMGQPTRKQSGVDNTRDGTETRDTSNDQAGQTTHLSGQFGRYQIVRMLGEGAMGAVYLASDTQLERDVALKVPKFSGEISPKKLERFYREARAAATLRHPNTCPVYDVGELNGVHFISMAFIEGRALSDFIEQGSPLTQRKIANIVRKTALALHEAHTLGMIHRDLKPANIMIDNRGEPIVMDFGLARQIEADEDGRLTQQGIILGTPAYMSPEQIEGDPAKIGPSVDIYSLGVVLYELLTHQLPFPGTGSVMSIIGEVLTRDAPSPAAVNPAVDPQLSAICEKAMAHDRQDRYPSMKDFATALANFIKSVAASGNSDVHSTASASPQSDDNKTTKLERVETAKAKTAAGTNAALIERLESQTKQVRELWKSQDFESAAKILSGMITITDPDAAKYVEWAKTELPKAQAKAAARAQPKAQDSQQRSKRDSAVLDDVWQQEFTASPMASVQRPLAANRRVQEEPSLPPWVLPVAIVVPVVVILFLIVLSILGGGDGPAVVDRDVRKPEPKPPVKQPEHHPSVSPPAAPTTQDNHAPANTPSSPGAPSDYESQGTDSSEPESFDPPSSQDAETPPDDRPANDDGRRKLFPPREAALAELDKNGDGRLTFDEVPVPFREALKQADTNEDGFVTPEEFAERPRRKPGFKRPRNDDLYKNIFDDEVKRLMIRYDEDGDLKLSYDELPVLYQDEMKFADRNRDGYIDVFEARNLINRASR